MGGRKKNKIMKNETLFIVVRSIVLVLVGIVSLAHWLNTKPDNNIVIDITMIDLYWQVLVFALSFVLALAWLLYDIFKEPKED